MADSWAIEASTIVAGEELGRGSFGVVRSATWRHTPVAIKILYLDAQAEDQELFEKEVATMSTLHHPNIVQFLGYTRTPGLTLVIELFAEGSLEAYVNRHRLPPKLALRFCIDMALAIEYLHSRRPSIVIHRDVKPANFLLTRSLRVKLGDFGIARTRAGDARLAVPPLNRVPSLIRTRSSEEMTANCGTVRFMAPEVASSNKDKSTYSTKADIFSLALVFYFVWERLLPTIPKHTTPAAHVDAMLRGLRPAFHKTPKPLRTIVDFMWHPRASSRLSAPEVLDHLTAIDEKDLRAPYFGFSSP
ncbi:hypothetical protein CTAYLR_008511 [Chrysophaeum taylorii]|uniref:Protein kinase domain-containing protein n=1 Tax=Chrysophaeum taylorii TaxID=2483200 RepID=A0AAD7U9N1_9STRA|nr:hypothetical protein CTAYLR_008511 [Chrysophaeum taylorii]